MASIVIEREIAAPPEIVFDLFTDHRGYADISPLRRSELEREGDPAPNGVGAVRALHGLGPPMREEVIVYDRPRQFSYHLFAGLPLRDHLGTVALRPSVTGTSVTYTVRAIPTVPIGGALVMWGLRLGVSRLVAGVARASERRAAEGGRPAAAGGSETTAAR
jgi:hypothetical protein